MQLLQRPETMVKMSTDANVAEGEEPARGGGKKGLIFGTLAAVLLAAGGFYSTYSGLIDTLPTTGGNHESADEHGVSVLSGIGFVPLDPLVVSLGRESANRHLRFVAQLEVAAAYQDEVSGLKPRILDVLNSYLRAVDTRDIENPSAMWRLRAQMLRRVQVVTGEGRVNDLLITEFVLN